MVVSRNPDARVHLKSSFCLSLTREFHEPAALRSVQMRVKRGHGKRGANTATFEVSVRAAIKVLN